jgi:hypothetical protein
MMEGLRNKLFKIQRFRRCLRVELHHTSLLEHWTLTPPAETEKAKKIPSLYTIETQFSEAPLVFSSSSSIKNKIKSIKQTFHDSFP